MKNNRLFHNLILLAGIALVPAGCSAMNQFEDYKEASAQAANEPDVTLAEYWWPDMTSTWTPIGWPDHSFKYSVFYNGTILLAPASDSLHPHSQVWQGEDFQLTFQASPGGEPWQIPAIPVHMRLSADEGRGIQEWVPDHEAPVLRTEFRHKDGFVLCSDMFAHIKSGKSVKTSLEPEYGWIRISVKHVDEYYHPKRAKMSILLTRRMIYNQVYRPDRLTALKQLALFGTNSGARVMDADRKVRISVLGATPAVVGQVPRWQEILVSLTEISANAYNLVIDLPCEEGAYVDVILPAMVDDPDDTAAEEAVTYDGALKSADAFWASQKPSEGAVFEVPEDFINEALEANLKFLPVLGEKDYENGEYCYLSSTLVYEGLWTTPGSMIFHMFLDQMGWFPMTEHYSEVFFTRQGTSTAPGPSFTPHPGYFSSPRYLAAIDWMTDHGAIMQQIATHALLSGDKQFIDKWTGPLVKACDFIKDMSLMEHSGIPGLLPPAWSSDEQLAQQSTWNLAWNYKGLVTTVRLLEKINHPRAEEFRAFADQYKETFLEAYRKLAMDGPRWTDKNGRLRYQPPTALAVEGEANLPPSLMVDYPGLPEGYTVMSDAFYLDCGPLCLVWSGLMDADDPIMKDILDFFREGPNWELQSALAPFGALERAVLVHEMSSCEPCYSFNMFHNWQKGDREHYLEGMYSLLVGSISQKTYISCEHRHHVQGTLFSYPLAFYFSKLAVVDDQIEVGSLHLLRFCPLAWVSKEKPMRIANMPTEFGPIDLTVQLSQDGSTLEVSFSNSWDDAGTNSISAGSDTIHGAPDGVVLHVPPVPGLRSVRVNEKKYSASKGEIKL